MQTLLNQNTHPAREIEQLNELKEILRLIRSIEKQANTERAKARPRAGVWLSDKDDDFPLDK